MAIAQLQVIVVGGDNIPRAPNGVRVDLYVAATLEGELGRAPLASDVPTTTSVSATAYTGGSHGMDGVARFTELDGGLYWARYRYRGANYWQLAPAVPYSVPAGLLLETGDGLLLLETGDALLLEGVAP